MKHITRLCGQNVRSFDVKLGGTCICSWALKAEGIIRSQCGELAARTENWCQSLHQYHPNNIDVFVFVQGMLMARAVGIQCPGAVLPVGEERSAGCTNGTSNSQAPVTQHGVSTSASLQGNIQHIADRLHALHEFHENRNQVYSPKRLTFFTHFS